MNKIIKGLVNHAGLVLNQYLVKHNHPTDKNKYTFSTITAQDIKKAKQIAKKFVGVISVDRKINQT